MVINGAPSNRIGPDNVIRNNIIGVEVVGIVANGPDPNRDNYNWIFSNQIETNLIGVRLNSSALTAIFGNVITRNIGTGVSIEGALATSNFVQANQIVANVGDNQANRQPRLGPRGRRGRRVTPSRYSLGTGVFITGGRNNVVGAQRSGRRAQVPAGPDFLSILGRPANQPGNVISGNAVAGVYLFGGAIGNSIRKNAIGTFRDPYGNGTVNGDYGVLVFNSAANVSDVSRRGPDANRITSGQIASFREFTGPVTSPLFEVPSDLSQAVPQST